MPPAGNDFLSNREVEAVVKYLFAKDVGKGPATYDDASTSGARTPNSASQ